MKFRLTFFALWCCLLAVAQPEFTLKSGEQLSDANHFGQSTEALEAFILQNPSRLYDHSQALLLISYNHMQLGDYANALAANTASLNIKARLHADDLVNNYVRYGAIHLLRGNYHAALSYLLRAKEFPIEALQLYAVIDGFLAAAYRGLAQFTLAEQHYRQSIETLLIEYPEDHPNVITSFHNLGNLYLEWDRPSEARQYFQQGLDRLQSSSEQTFMQALLFNGIGASYTDDPQQAEHFHRMALDVATEHFGGYHRETATASILLAGALYRQQKRDAAKDAIQLAIHSLAPEQPQLTWDQLPDTAKIVIDRSLMAEALGWKARWLTDAAVPMERKLPMAMACSEIAAKFLSLAMDDLIDQADRLQLIPIARRAVEAGVEAGIRSWEENRDRYGRQRAFQLLTWLKALEFRANTANTLPLQGDFPDRERQIHRALNLAEMKFRLQPLDITVSRQIYRVREDYRRLKADWLRIDPAGYQQRFGLHPATLTDIQQDLAPDAALLSYFIGEKAGYLFGIRNSDMQVFRIPGREGEGEPLPAAVSRTIGNFQLAIDSSNAELFVEQAYALYRRFLEPAASWMKRQKQLVIAPDGPLRHLPFEALLTKPNRKKRIRFQKQSYLINDFAVGYQEVPVLWQNTPMRSRPPAYEFLFVSPVFDEQGIAGIPADQKVLFDPRIHIRSRISDGRKFYWMPQAAVTAKALQGLLAKTPKEGRFKLREAATENILREEFGQARFIHLSSYAFVEGPSPEEAGLVFANPLGSHSSDNDGLLLASELPFRSSAAADLLSIDFAELGDDRGEHSMPITPLAGSLLLSGISHVVYTERMQGAASFFPLFYEQLLRNNRPMEALQAAKIALAKKEETAAPKWWSPYRLLTK